MFGFFENKKILDSELLEKIEEELILSDIGLELTNSVIKELKKSKINQEVSLDSIKEITNNILYNSVSQYYKEDTLFINSVPYVILVSGTNGSGKTTSIAKLAKYYKDLGLKILLAPCDTFRAGSREQLSMWAEKVGVDIFVDDKIKDPAAIAYKALSHSIENNYEVLIIDTAGRLDGNTALMNELKKIETTIKKISNDYPQQSLLVLDGTIGQTALKQAINFSKVINITGLIVTKVDSQAKGGIVLNVTKHLKIPIYFLGIGEKSEDFKEFNLKDYIRQLI